MKGRLMYIMLVIISGSIHLAGNGQEKIDMTLSDAIRQGLENNFDIQITGLRKEIATNSNTWGMAGRYPYLSFSLSDANSFGSDRLPDEIDFDDKTYTINGVIDASWTIFNGFKVKYTKTKLNLLEELSGGNASIVIENTIQAIINTYNEALVEDEKLLTLMEIENQSLDKYERVKLRREIGAVGLLDDYYAENSYLSDKQNVLLQQVNAKNAIRKLNLLLGADSERKLLLVDSLYLQSKKLTLEELISLLDNNSGLQAQYINSEILKTEINLQEANKYPKLSLSTGFRATDISSLSPARNFDQGSLDYYANFSLSYTLFNGHAIKRSIENARIQEKIGLLDVDEIKLTLQSRIYQMFDNYTLQYEVFDIAQKALETAKLSLKVADEKFKTGVITAVQYRDFQNNYLRSSFALQQVKFNIKSFELELLRLSGGIINEGGF